MTVCRTPDLAYWEQTPSIGARSVAPVSKPAPAKLHSPISKLPYLPNLDFGRNWNRRRCSAVIPFCCHTLFFSLALHPVLSFMIFIVSSSKCLIIMPPWKFLPSKPSPMSELGLRHLHLGVSSWHSHGYKDMQDMVENVKLDIYGAFLVRFLWFFFCLM